MSSKTSSSPARWWSFTARRSFPRTCCFAGGTALHKLVLHPSARYSEDLDFVQMKPEPIGPVLDIIRARLDPWLGEPRHQHSTRGTTLTYRVQSELPPVTPLRLKIEINTREHFQVFGVERRAFAIETRWFTGACDIPTYALDELLATKLRALTSAAQRPRPFRPVARPHARRRGCSANRRGFPRLSRGGRARCFRRAVAAEPRREDERCHVSQRRAFVAAARCRLRRQRSARAGRT